MEYKVHFVLVAAHTHKENVSKQHNVIVIVVVSLKIFMVEIVILN